MPRLLNLGSLNIDHTYQVPHVARPGETLSSTAYARGPGGKGLNQSIAAARAGAAVSHAGRIGEDGLWLRDLLGREGIEISRLAVAPDCPTGHAIIQVTPGGENAIVLQAGANHALRPDELPAIFDGTGPGDWFLTQNETACVPEALRLAAERGLRVAFNPAPAHPSLAHTCPLERLDLLIVNETEAEILGGSSDPDLALRHLRERCPKTTIVLTLGARGARLVAPGGEHSATAPRVEAVDTTAAGDTFIGYLLAEWMAGASPASALRTAVRAAALSVTRPGAAASIPLRCDLSNTRL